MAGVPLIFGRTFKSRAPKPPTPWPEVHPYMERLKTDFQPDKLSKEEIGVMSQEIDVPRACMLALVRQESSNAGFARHEDGYWRPKIRLELHKLNQFTDGTFQSEQPGLFKSKFNVKDSNAPQDEQYRRLNQALLTIEGLYGHEPALSATSWGLNQVMGFNFRLAGSGTIDRFVARMVESEREQLKASITFIDSHPAMRRALANRDWITFARHYNGTARVAKYAAQIAQNFFVVSGRRA